MKILFVCSSNVCRSPYCEFIMKKLIKNSPVLSRAGIEVSSSAVLNHSRVIFPKTAVALRREGFSAEEINSFRPSHKCTEKKRFEEADVIIGMSKAHKWLTPAKYRNKYISLSEAATGTFKSVPDPFLSRTQESYDVVMSRLKQYLVLYADKLQKEFSK